MRKLIVFVMLFCLMPQAWAERMRGTGVREPAAVGLYEAGNELFVIRVNSDGEIIVDNSGGAGGAGATEVTLAALLAKVIAAPSTEAKQDDLNALIVIIDAVLDAIKLDTANISADQATETTAAAILAKLIAAPATEAKQDSLNALIVIIDAVLDAIKLDTANISSDQATETTSAAILAKIIAAPATEAKQDTGNTSLSNIETDVATGTVVDHAKITVGASATLILAADSTRKSITVINDFTNLVAIGNSDVTINTAPTTDGFVLAKAGSAASGKGGSLTIFSTSAIYGIGESASSRVIYFVEKQ